MAAGETEYRFLWMLENYANIKKYSKFFESPVFTIEGLERTSWCLELFQPESTVTLHRCNGEGPENIPIKFELTITTGDGSTVYSQKSEGNFSWYDSRSFPALADMDVRIRSSNLVLRCNMRRGEGRVEKVTRCTVRSRAVLQKVSFFLKVKNFSNRKINRATTFKAIPSACKTGRSFSAYLECDNGSITIVVESSRDPDFRPRTVWLIDASGNTTEVAVEQNDSSSSSSEEDQKDNLPTLTRQFILSNRKKYLPNDELTLMCELLFQHDEHKTEETLHEIPIATYLDKNRDV